MRMNAFLTPLMQKENSKSTWTGRQIRNPKKESDFLASFNSGTLQEVCVRAMALVDDNVGQALDLCTSSLLRASERKKKNQKKPHLPTGISRKDSLWLGDDYRMAKH